MNDSVNILAVDDRPENLLSIEAILDNPKLNIIKALSGNEALALTCEHDFALILLDVQMPDMDGFETAQLLRSRYRTKHIPIIFVTAINKEQKHVFTGYEKGAVDYLFKPIEPRILGSKVQVFVDLYRQKKELEITSCELRQSMAKLEQAHSQRISLEEQLHQAKKMEALGTLTGGIAHDFNNMLHGMSGYIQLLMGHNQDDEICCDYLTNLEKITERAGALIQRLLLFCYKTKPTSFKYIDINDIIKESLCIIEKNIPDHITLDVKLTSKQCIILGENVQIEQILLNLVSNASDAMSDIGRLGIYTRKIFLSAEQAIDIGLSEGDYVVISVCDTGHGIEPDIKEHIFEPFFTTKELGKGTGLGLSSVYGVVKSHGGKIICDSSPGLGTTFDVYLPVTEQQALNDDYDSSDLELKNGAGNILIIDDEEDIRNISKEILEQKGYNVLEAENGEDALLTISREKCNIDLVILDLGMPGMGGEKCLQQLKCNHSYLKIIVSSGEIGHDIIHHPQKYGVDSVLHKPFNMKVLLRAVGSAMQDRCRVK